MAKVINKLTAIDVKKNLPSGTYPDGNNLYLQVSPSGSKSWLFRFTLRGRAREMGLGPIHTVSLAEARERAKKARLLLIDGVDPLEDKKAQRLRVERDAARQVTFEAAARDYINMRRPEWKNAKHADQWLNTLAAYAFPLIGQISVADIDTRHVMQCLKPLWTAKPETASRLRGRIENVLSWATASELREGSNPARWRGHLDEMLPAPTKVKKVTHFPALPRTEVQHFMQRLRARVGTSYRALEFTILTGARTTEVLQAKWAEVDTKERLWTVPASRMKGGREHRFPLSSEAMKVLESLPADSPYIFGTSSKKGHLSSMALLSVIDKMGHKGLITVHGFRSTLRDWAAEVSDHANEVAEMALAHVVGNKVEAAYRRGDLLAKRFRLMEDWAKFCAGESEGFEVNAEGARGAAH